MPDRNSTHTWIELRFPLGAYYAQSASDFGRPEWPPSPVRVLAAFIAAAASLGQESCGQARSALEALATCPEPPVIVAPRADEGPDGLASVAAFRGASRWAPRNHELGELKQGVHPRDLGRGRAAVNKGGISIGDIPVRFVWPLRLSDALLGALQRAAAEVAFVGTSRSPVVTSVGCSGDVGIDAAWLPVERRSGNGVDVRVPNATLVETLDSLHERRKGNPRRDGRPARAPLVAPPSHGRWQRHAHSTETSAGPASFDPQHWGDMLVLAVDRDSIVRPKGPAAYVLARATRAALLAAYEPAGTDGEAPPVLRGRNSEPHAAFVPLPFVGHPHADGRILGVAIVLPHPRRAAGVLEQRHAVARGIRALLTARPNGERTTVGVPGVGDVLLGEPPHRPLLTLQPARWLGPSRKWATATPVVHSRFRRNTREDGLLEQLTADCRDVGLPSPERVEVRRVSRFHAAPTGIGSNRGPKEWGGPLRGPVDHLELTFAEAVAGPLLLGRARHFGLGLCLPSEDMSDS